MRKQIKYLSALLLLFNFLFVNAEKYTLNQCIEIALHNNLQVQQQENEMRQQQLAYDQARQNLLPAVSANAGQNWSWGRSTGVDNVMRAQNIANTSFSLNANLVLFDGLSMKYNIDQSKALVNKTEADMQQLKLDISLNITAMFLQVLLDKELEQTAQEQLALTQRKIEKTQALVEAQRTAQGELYSMQAQEAKEQLALVQAQNTTKLALLDLAQAMELPYSDSFDIVHTTTDSLDHQLLPDKTIVYQEAMSNRPELKAAQYALEAQQIGLKNAKSAYYPTLSAGTGISTGYYHLYGADNVAFGKQLGDNFTTNVGLNLTIPIFDRMQTPNAVKRQEINVQNAKLNIEQITKDIQKEIDQAYYNALAAQTQQQSAEQALTYAQEAFRYAEQKQEAGKGTIYELYEAKKLLTQAQSEQLQAKYNYIFKVRILQYYAGK